MTETFEYWGDIYEYENGSYNDARWNERAVEVPIAKDFVGHGKIGIGFELGNVLDHYDYPEHVVIDRYEQGDNIYNFDVFEVSHGVDWIVAISTIEHVRWDEPGLGREWDGSVRAIEHLYGLLRPGGRMLITVPMGWNPYLDTAILDGAIVRPNRQCTMVRDGRLNTVTPRGDIARNWVQTSELSHRRYAASTVWAESVWIAEWVKS